MLLCQKIFKKQPSDKLLKAIAQISFSLPTYEFLGEIGFETLNALSPFKSQELRD